MKTPIEHEDSHPQRGSSKKLTFVVSTLGLLLLTFAFFTRALWIAPPPNFWEGFDQGTNQSKLERNFAALHPEEHVSRAPLTLKQVWKITACHRRPDGVLKRVYCINDHFPGPTIEARSGDRLIVEVVNALDEGVAFHWHGLWMKGANEMDGAVGITQSPIAPGQRFLYNFTIDEQQSGTFWYHAHHTVQRADGLYGGLVVHSPLEKQNQVTLDAEYLLMASDWYHRAAKDALDFYMHPGSFGNEPVPDSLLLNGEGYFHCADAAPARPVDCKSRISEIPGLKLDRQRRNIIRLINTGSYAGISFTIHGAYVTPVKVDGGNKVSSAAAKSVGILYPGERVDLSIQPARTVHNEALEITLDETPFKYPNSALTLKHQFSFGWTNAAEAVETAKGAFETLDLQSMLPSSPPSSALDVHADETIVLYAITQKLSHLDNVPRGFINSTSWEPSKAPLSTMDRRQWDKNQFVPRIELQLLQTRWVDVVLNNLDEEGHPFHLHGHQFYVLSTYSSRYNWGSYNPFEDAEPPGGSYDIKQAVMKDTVYVPRRGYAIIRIPFDHSGIWMFHCHVQWHQASGMAMAFEVG